MIALATVIERFAPQYLERYGNSVLPSQRQALRAMVSCRSFRVVHVASVVQLFFPPPNVHGGMYGNVLLRFAVPQSTVVRGRGLIRRVVVV